MIITELANKIKAEFFGESTGHDWYHIERVWKTAKHIAEKEGANVEVVELGALLHDIADHKFHDNAVALANKRINELLGPYDMSTEVIQAVKHIVANCSFKGGVEGNKMESLEGKIVQDADRLDAIGAIGIARTFAYGGKRGNMIYDPLVKPMNYSSAEEYKNSKSHTINHFYEKLLLLKDTMNTDTAREMAIERNAFMEKFLEQFYAEWKANYWA